jgi:hypothetical protein
MDVPQIRWLVAGFIPHSLKFSPGLPVLHLRVVVEPVTMEQVFTRAPHLPPRYPVPTTPRRTPAIFSGGGGSTKSVEDRGQREQGSGGGSRLVRGSGGSCNLVQEISFHIVKLS